MAEDEGAATLRFSGMIVEQEFVVYDGMLLDFLAVGPVLRKPNNPCHRGHWLVTWRHGGRLSVPHSVPSELAGVMQWLAIPVSELRARQITEGHISLREAMALSEWELFRLEGEDPLNPDRCEGVRFSDLPKAWIPNGDVTVGGKALPDLLVLGESLNVEVGLHIVPGEGSDETPSFATVGLIQGSFQRFLSWAARCHHPSTEAAPVINRQDWAALGFTKFRVGTAWIVGKAAVDDQEGREAILGGLKMLKLLTESLPLEDGSPRVDAVSRHRAVEALLGLIDQVESCRVSLSIRWRGSEGEECVLLGPRTASQMLSNLESVRDGPAQVPNSPLTFVRVVLNSDAINELNKEADAQKGGLQKLIVDIRKQVVERRIDGSCVIDLTAPQVEKVVRYVQEYGRGGFQDRLRPVYQALYGLGVAFGGLR